jgi:anti-anti-sigma regulatory factor
VSAIERPTPADLDHLARLLLTARRAGRELALADPPERLRMLLLLVGLGGLLDVPSVVRSREPHRESP